MQVLEDFVAIDPTSKSGLCWLVRPYKTRHNAGDAAFASLDTNGYYRGRFNYKRYMAHQIVFYLTHGYFPRYIDHIDGDRTNNHPDNLREVTASQNQHNRKGRGYTFDRCNNRWKAQIRVAGIDHHLGMFTSEDAARRAYVEAKRKYHPTAPARCYEVTDG